MVDLSQPVEMSFIIETIVFLLVVTGVGIFFVNYKTKKENR